MRLAVITSKFPFDHKEQFLYAEIAELAQLAESLAIVPATARQRTHPYPELPGCVVNLKLLSLGTLCAALAEFCRAPFATLRTLNDVIRMPRSRRTKLNNFRVFPKALAIERLVRKRGITHVHAYWLSTPSTIAYVCSCLANIDWSSSGHRWDLVDTNLTSEPVPRAGFMGKARFIRTISERGRRQVLRALGEQKNTQVPVIHLGVEHRRFETRLPPSRRPLSLVCIAGLFPVKGHSFLLKGLAIARSRGGDFVCDLIGEGPLRSDLEKLASDLLIAKSINFLGWLPLETVHQRLRDGVYDAAILTSIDLGNSMCEGIPVSLMEAMANSVPCIATNSGSVGELIDDDVGILVAHGDVEEIARGILTMARDENHRLELGRRAAQRINDRFAVEKTAAALYTLMDGRVPQVIA